jgi:hypothetical protein
MIIMDTSLTQCQSAVAETPTTKKREKNEEKHYLVHWPVLVQYIVALTLLAGGGFVLISSTTTIPVTGAFAQEGNNNTTASTTTSNTTTITPSSGIELSLQPIWVEGARNRGVTPINETHRIVTFIGNGTLTVPNTYQTTI